MKRIKDNGFADIKIKFKNGSETERTVDYAPIQVDDILNYVKTHYLIEKVASVKVRSGQYWETIYDNGNISDSRKIKDADDTPLNGLLSIAFNDGTEDEMCKTVQQHANESGEINGIQYETYETDEQDGVAFVDLCAIGVSDATEFVKGLLEKWGVLENTADIDFDTQTEEEYNEEVADSRKIKDEDEFGIIQYVLTWEDANGRKCSSKGYRTLGSLKRQVDEYKHKSYDGKNFKIIKRKWYNAESSNDPKWGQVEEELIENISDSRKIGDMTKPIRWKAYAERMRAKRRDKNDEPTDEPENEKQDVADSRRVKDDKPKYDEYFVKIVECYINDGDAIVFVAALSKNGGDGAAIRRVQEKFPDLDIIEVYDTDGYIDVHNMTDAQYEFCEEGAIMIPEDMEFISVDDLEWI